MASKSNLPIPYVSTNFLRVAFHQCSRHRAVDYLISSYPLFCEIRFGESDVVVWSEKFRLGQDTLVFEASLKAKKRCTSNVYVAAK